MKTFVEAASKLYSIFNSKKRNIFLVAVISSLISCKKSETTTGPASTSGCSGVVKTFTADVKPLMQTTCATGTGCHGEAITDPAPCLISRKYLMTVRKYVL